MRKPALLKRFSSSRLLLPLATCSVALVMFSAIVYGAAVAGALSDDSESSPIFGIFPGAAAVAEAEPSNELANTAASYSSEGSNASFLTLMSPMLDTLAPLAMPTAKENGGKQEATVVSSKPAEESSTPSGSGEAAGSQQKPEQVEAAGSPASEPEPVFDAAAEKAFHDHIAKYYAELPSHYYHLCEGLNTAFATLNSTDPDPGFVWVTPVDAAAYRSTLSTKLREVQGCSYKGERITPDSKWYDEYVKVWRLYENLVNVSSMMDMIRGCTVSMARQQLAPALDGNGKLRDLTEFEQNYPKVKL